MKKLLFTFLTAGLLFSCSSENKGYVIEGTVTGEEVEGTKVYLRKANALNQMILVDTVNISSGTFSFRGDTIPSPELHYIFIDEAPGNIPIIVEKGTIEITTQRDSLNFAKISGTLQNELFSDFLKDSRAMNRRATSMNEDMRDAMNRKDTVVMNSLREEYFELQEEAKGYELKFAKNNPNSLIAALIIDKALTTKALEMAEVRELYELLTPEIQATSIGMKIKEKLDKIGRTSIGTKAPNFSAPSPTGEELALHDVLGKVTIVDFWAAWCRPCRAENPNLVRIYDKYKDQGLSIMGVSLDRSADDWKRAIEQDGLTWNQVSNTSYFDEIAQLYNVNAIPATFILDKNGIIVDRDLRGTSLENRIAELLQ
jgi:peroxiredoxin